MKRRKNSSQRLLNSVLDRERAAATLRESSEERYHLLVELAPVAIFVHSRGKLLFANAAGARMLGESRPEDLIEKSLMDFVHPDDRRAVAARLKQIEQGGQPRQQEETQFTTRDGRQLHVEVSSAPLTYQDQSARLVLVRDITRRKQLEDEVRRQNALLRALSGVAARINATLDSDQIMRTLGAELGRLDLTCLVALLDPTDGALVTRYHSNLERIGIRFEKVTGLPLRQFRILRENFPLYARLFVERSPKLVDYDEAVRLAIASVPFLPGGIVKQAARLLGVKPGEQEIFVPLVVEDRPLGMLVVRGKDLRDDDISPFTVFAGQVAAALENAHLFEQVRAGRERLKGVSQRLLEVQETERRHLARELHDEVGQALTSLQLMLGTAGRLPPDALLGQVRATQSLVDELIDRVHDLSLELRPAVLDDLGLLPALLWHIERYTAQTGVQVIFEHRELDRRFPLGVETVAYRIVQEALTNVARHASVGQATVQAWADENVLRLRIADTGVGFDAKAAQAAHASTGLHGMRERATLLSGDLTIASIPGRGAEVVAELPLSGSLERRNQRKKRK